MLAVNKIIVPEYDVLDIFLAKGSLSESESSSFGKTMVSDSTSISESTFIAKKNISYSN